MGRSAEREFSLELGATLLVGMRLCLLATLPPAGVVNDWVDTRFYYALAQWLDQGRLPYIHYWLEYPPVFGFFSVGVYWPSQQLGGDFRTYQMLLGALTLPFDLGTYLLLFRIGRSLHGEVTGRRIAWSWALFGYPIYVWRYSFDSVGVCLLLWGLERAISRRWASSGAILAIGCLVKVFPGLGIVALWRFGQRALAATLAAVAAATLLLVPLLLTSPRYVIASASSMLSRSSWETVWAILDRYLGTGNVTIALEDRLDPALAGVPFHTSAVPLWLPLACLLIALVLSWLAVPRRLTLAADVVGRTSLLLLAFLLVNKGWSPQFTVWLLPFVLLLLSTRRGVAYSLGLSALAVAEWPLAFTLGSPVVALVITLRTGVLLALMADFVLALRVIQNRSPKEC